ncbi:MAG TPA: hypothetical protein VHC68_00385 [Candidatus Paceibacterota bacterium]|nr:hypothetical protein [Candidatus Paceibacterota bacterium]
MNLEELSKPQLILLTILVNFVTSVATGILTVSLLDQAPPVVTRTVNQIVDHTIETVAAAAPVVAPPAVSAPAPSTEDLVTSALAAAQQRTVSIYPASGTTSPAIAVGTYLPASRAVATAALDALPAQAIIVFAGGTTSPASLAHEGGGIAIYGFGDSAELPAAPVPALVSPDTLKLGETVLAIDTDGSAATGIVSSVGKSAIGTTLGGIGTGVAAVDLSGNIVGLASGAAAGQLISAQGIFSLLSASSSATSSAAHS